MRVEFAWDVKAKIRKIVEVLEMKHIDVRRIFCMRSYGAQTDANARIWSLPKIWQKALGIKPHYVIEVVHEKFDKMSEEEQIKTLIHELLHIPKGFTGGLRPHKYFGQRIDGRRVNQLYKAYIKKLRSLRENS